MADAYDETKPDPAVDKLRESSAELKAIKARLNSFQKTAPAVAAPLVGLYVGVAKVVGAPDSGWEAATGTVSKVAYTAAVAGTAPGAYSQVSAQSVLDRLAATEARVAALSQALTTHGLIVA
jgi:hypothetical protein